MIDITGLREDKRPQSSAIVHALLDRLEAAEKERDKLKELNIALCTKSNSQVIHNARLAEENDTLHAKIEAMERQEPSEQDASVRKAWARFSHELHRSPDAPYPGMADAFEQHFSQSFIDREWRAEATTWAAAWKAAKSHCAQPAPSVPDGWLRAIDEALVTAHIGVANAHDTYEQAKAKLDNLIGFHVDVATDPDVNGGWKLAPIVSTDEMDKAGANHTDGYLSTAQMVWDAMLAVTPEAKP